ncbi:FidL [Affinibrenneria salicis]|uniref:FidL n=1 Tax=Affinibrenneria salicis TaxID=2590031 RepID=A0A5J5FWE5_9GAMM|nr:FidL [Affinibrenneria salicis]KAA8997638.1 FidL [Affinibrenneria salicis]
MYILKVRRIYIFISVAVLILLFIAFLTYHYHSSASQSLMCRAEINTSIREKQSVIVKSYVLNFYLGKNGRGAIAVNGLYINVGQPPHIIERTLTFDYNWNGNYLSMRNIAMHKNMVDNSPDDAIPYSPNEVIRFEMLTDNSWLISSFRPDFTCNIR